MSICGGIAGLRGSDPKGIFIHNDAGSQNANKEYYDSWLRTHNLGSGFAHYYVCNDGVLQAEDDQYKAWHCGQSDGNRNYLSIEVCQSLGDLDIFKENENVALMLAADKCKQYGIAPSSDTIKLHQEVFPTSCPHRSVEIHGGREQTKQYFVDKISEYMASSFVGNLSIEEDDTMKCFYTIDDKGPVMYFDGKEAHPLASQDEMTVINNVYVACTGRNIPCFSWYSVAPWFKRLLDGVNR